MLVLTRRVNERILIGDNIVITYLGNKGYQAQIGIDAPKHIPIVRQELLYRTDKGDNECKETTF